jgi:hypothetical protein
MREGFGWARSSLAGIVLLGVLIALLMIFLLGLSSGAAVMVAAEISGAVLAVFTAFLLGPTVLVPKLLRSESGRR